MGYTTENVHQKHLNAQWQEVKLHADVTLFHLSVCVTEHCVEEEAAFQACVLPLSLSKTDKPAQFTSPLWSATDKQHKSFFHVKQFSTTCSAATCL